MPRRLIATAALVALAPTGPAAPPRDALRLHDSVDLGWRFHRGEAVGAAAPAFDDRAWRVVDVPHDWSLEDLPVDDPTRDPVLALVPGAWRFHAGDDAAWSAPDLDASGWQEVALPERKTQKRQHESTKTRNGSTAAVSRAA